ncbi:2993_t:CDS:2 [Cetraspora pellucida]|uniref:2993_t:CDS:1 n=1 Tax=Cetraspora pellucida TaxID=1433469 RepID=A0A9N8ZGW9_9GLOM|nr:2993_t:CDS:2 [Cetraspora pellucida]
MNYITNIEVNKENTNKTNNEIMIDNENMINYEYVIDNEDNGNKVNYEVNSSYKIINDG